MCIISIMGVILLWIVVSLILGVLGFTGLTYRLLRRIYIELYKTNDEDKSE